MFTILEATKSARRNASEIVIVDYDSAGDISVSSSSSNVTLRNRDRRTAKSGKATKDISQMVHSNGIQIQAELRAWQHTQYVLQYIRYASDFLVRNTTCGVFTDACMLQTLDLMMEDIRNLGTSPPAPACPKLDDKEQVLNGRYFFEERNMSCMIKAMPPAKRLQFERCHHRFCQTYPSFLNRHGIRIVSEN